ncbi:MAG TPA: hypothetical protein VEQ10_10190 [Vicinamibacteria bacterium]|nr:hypothetical protein [Vicinamibacteria bacterium]
MGLYPLVLLAHSWLRWAVLLLALALLARTAAGWLRSRPWARADERLQVALVATMDVELLLGLALYLGLSPLTRAFLADPAVAMRAPALRFFGAEHVMAMVLAVAVAHAGRVASRRATTPAGRQRRACVTALLVLVLVVAAIPWPALSYGRPLFRTASPAAATVVAQAARQLYYSSI